MNIDQFITAASVTVAVLAIGANFIQMYFREREAKYRIRYGIVYQEQFRVCKELYTRLSRLRDAIVMIRDPRTFGSSQREWVERLTETANALRRSIKQNDVVLPIEIGDHLNRLWASIKERLDEIEDGMTTQPEGFRLSCTNAIEYIDEARTQLAPFFRETFGIEQARAS